MGRIKSLMVKRTAKQLLTEGVFTEDFNKNKPILKQTMPSKPIRNKVAGYLARLTKINRLLKEKEAKAASMPKPMPLEAAE